MLPLPSGSLSVSRRVLRALRGLNIAYGVGILVLLVASFVAPDPLFRALGVQGMADGSAATGMRLIMFFGIAAVPAVHVVLSQLIAMVDSVSAGDPFIHENSRRLTTLAWVILLLEILRIAVGVAAARVADAAPGLDIRWSFSFTPWLAVLLLFVLARVFEHGARMRTDLEGTV